jgi:hypothetical protein
VENASQNPEHCARTLHNPRPQSHIGIPSEGPEVRLTEGKPALTCRSCTNAPRCINNNKSICCFFFFYDDRAKKSCAILVRVTPLKETEETTNEACRSKHQGQAFQNYRRNDAGLLQHHVHRLLAPETGCAAMLAFHIRATISPPPERGEP